MSKFIVFFVIFVTIYLPILYLVLNLFLQIIRDLLRKNASITSQVINNVPKDCGISIDEYVPIVIEV